MSIDSIIKLIEKHLQVIRQVIILEGKVAMEANFMKFTKLIFLNRHYHILHSVKLLLPILNDNMFYKFPIYVLLRVGISDYITYCYLGPKTEDEVKKYLCSSYKYTKDESPMDRIFYEQYFNKFKNKGGNIEYENPSIAVMYKILKNDEKYSNLSKELYTLYNILSKHEHINALTYLMYTNNVPAEVEWIQASIFHILKASKILMLSLNDDFSKELSDEISELCVEELKIY